MRNIQFQVGDKVRLKGTNRTGEVKSYRIEGYKVNGVDTEVITYQVNLGGYYNDNYREDKLEPLMSYDFTQKFESQLLDFLIDVYLKHKKFDSIKLLSQQKYREDDIL